MTTMKAALVLVWEVTADDGYVVGTAVADMIRELDPPGHGFGEVRVCLDETVDELVAWLDEVDHA